MAQHVGGLLGRPSLGVVSWPVVGSGLLSHVLAHSTDGKGRGFRHLERPPPSPPAFLPGGGLSGF